MTTFVGYGQVPGHRQAEIMRTLHNPQPRQLPPEGLLDALETLLQNAKRAPPSSARVTVEQYTGSTNSQPTWEKA
jgi:hypothetical protein